MTADIEITGQREVQKNLRKLIDNAPEAFAAALWQNAQDIQRVASTKVPVDYGTLKRSWLVDAPKFKGSEISVDVGYGTHYAIFVHERTDVSHSTGQAKFLEDAIKEESGGFSKKLAKRAEKILESGHPGITPKRESGPDFEGSL